MVTHRLYFAAYTDDDGENWDGFAVATTSPEALDLWRAMYGFDADTKPKDLYIVPAAVEGPARVLEWFTDIKTA